MPVCCGLFYLLSEVAGAYIKENQDRTLNGVDFLELSLCARKNKHICRTGMWVVMDRYNYNKPIHMYLT